MLMEQNGMNIKKAFLLQTATGPVIILTRYNSLKDAGLIMALADRDIDKFEAHELPLPVVQFGYREHMTHLMTDPAESDELVVLDDDGKRVYNNINFREMGQPIYFDKMPLD